MIKSFLDVVTEKIFYGDVLSKKERKQIGSLDLTRAKRRLETLDSLSEKDLLVHSALHYHTLTGTNRYSIDAVSRNSPWRITFSWEDEEMAHVELVKIEDTH